MEEQVELPKSMVQGIYNYMRVRPWEEVQEVMPILADSLGLTQQKVDINSEVVKKILEAKKSKNAE